MATKLKMLLVSVAVLAATFHSSMADTYVVGDAFGWNIPQAGPDPNVYTKWVSGKTFITGDVLVFNFTTGFHTVAEVTKASFDSCDTTSPISLKGTGPASITLSTAGEHYFICTFPGHCGAGQKIAINVSGAPSTTPTPAPAPRPSTRRSSPPPSAPVPSASSPTAPEPTSSPSPSPSPSRAPKIPPAPAPSVITPKTYIVNWTVPSGGASDFINWASDKTFNVGDILVFNFTTGWHTVAALTSQAAFNSCDPSGVNATTDGPANITLTTAGEHFYICTKPGHCLGGQKLAINVTGAGSPTPSGASVPPPSSSTPSGGSAPPPPSSAPSFAGAAWPLTFVAVALAFLY